MRISRCDAELLKRGHIDYEEWPVLLDSPISEAEFPDGVSWDAIGGETWAGPAYIQLQAAADGESPRYKYEIQIRPSEVGELLRRMPVEAVPVVVGGLLGGDSEVIGAVVGQLIAYLTRLSAGGAERPDA